MKIYRRNLTFKCLLESFQQAAVCTLNIPFVAYLMIGLCVELLLINMGGNLGPISSGVLAFLIVASFLTYIGFILWKLDLSLLEIKNIFLKDVELPVSSVPLDILAVLYSDKDLQGLRESRMRARDRRYGVAREPKFDVYIGILCRETILQGKSYFLLTIAFLFAHDFFFELRPLHLGLFDLLIVALLVCTTIRFLIVVHRINIGVYGERDNEIRAILRIIRDSDEGFFGGGGNSRSRPEELESPLGYRTIYEDSYYGGK